MVPTISITMTTTIVKVPCDSCALTSMIVIANEQDTIGSHADDTFRVLCRHSFSYPWLTIWFGREGYFQTMCAGRVHIRSRALPFGLLSDSRLFNWHSLKPSRISKKRIEVRCFEVPTSNTVWDGIVGQQRAGVILRAPMVHAQWVKHRSCIVEVLEILHQIMLTLNLKKISIQIEHLAQDRMRICVSCRVVLNPLTGEEEAEHCQIDTEPRNGVNHPYLEIDSFGQKLPG